MKSEVMKELLLSAMKGFLLLLYAMLPVVIYLAREKKHIISSYVGVLIMATSFYPLILSTKFVPFTINIITNYTYFLLFLIMLYSGGMIMMAGLVKYEEDS